MQKPIDALKLSSQDWSKLQQLLKKQTSQPSESIRDGGIRMDMDDSIIALLRIVTNGHQSQYFHIRCRNISSSGLGFMHGRFIHPGTSVQITLVTPDRKGMIVEGSIVRARLIDKNIHELGVKFDETLDFDEVVSMGLAPAPTAEALEAERQATEAATAAKAAKLDKSGGSTADVATGEANKTDATSPPSEPDDSTKPAGEAIATGTRSPAATGDPHASESDKNDEPVADAA